MPCRPELEGLETRALVERALDRFRELAICTHPLWWRYQFAWRDDAEAHRLLCPAPELLAALDGAAIAGELAELAEAIAARGRRVDAALCWAQVGTYWSKRNPNEPESRWPFVKTEHDWAPRDMPPSLRAFWETVDDGRATEAFSRAGLALLAAHDEAAERAVAVLGRRCGAGHQIRRRMHLAALLDEESFDPRHPRVDEVDYRVQVLLCAHSALFCLDRSGAPAPEPSLRFLGDLDGRWDDWLAPLLDVERANWPSRLGQWHQEPLEVTRARVTRALGGEGPRASRSGATELDHD